MDPVRFTRHYCTDLYEPGNHHVVMPEVIVHSDSSMEVMLHDPSCTVIQELQANAKRQ